MPEPTLLDFSKAFANTLSKTDFEAAFAKIVKLVEKMLEKHERAIQALETRYASLTDSLRKDHASSLSELKGKVNDLFVKDRLDNIESSIGGNFTKARKELNDIVDAKLKEADFRVSQLKPIKGDKGDRGEIGPMPTEHLQLMKDMMAEMKKVQNILSNIPRGKAMGRAKVPTLQVIDLTTSFDGVATTATLPRDTVKVHMVWSTQFPQILRPNVDFTLSGNTLTLVTRQVGTVESGQTVVALIETLFYSK